MIRMGLLLLTSRLHPCTTAGHGRSQDHSSLVEQDSMDQDGQGIRSFGKCKGATVVSEGVFLPGDATL